MEISSTTSAQLAVRAQSTQLQNAARASASQLAGADGPDKENDGDSDDRAVTSTRGNNLNIKA